jgi:hypothetical protein
VNVDYATLPDEVESGVFRERLKEELTAGFREIHESGERLPPASYYAAQIAEIISRNSEGQVDSTLAYHVYQEILLACEDARAAVLGGKPASS